MGGTLALLPVLAAAMVGGIAQGAAAKSHVSPLPDTPAYAKPALHRLTGILHRSTKPVRLAVIVDSPARIRALDQYSQEVATPGSRVYRHFLTPEEVTRRFGPTASLLKAAKASMARTGWRIVAEHGLVTDVVAARGPKAKMPVSRYIWSVAGASPARAVPEGITLTAAGRVAALSGTSRRGARAVSHKVRRTAALPPVPASVLAPYGFRLSPTWGTSTLEANGDTAFVVSFNPLLTAGGAGVPAGLPVNLVVGAVNPQGVPVPVTVTSVSDAQNALVAYGNGSAFPGTQGTLWQVTVAGAQAVGAGDTLRLGLDIGSALSATLPAFTGRATALGPLTGPQLADLSDASSILAGASAPDAPTVAIYDQGEAPNLADLDNLMAREGLAAPVVTVEYEDGATAQTTTTSQSEIEETTEDIEAVASVAPGVHIVEYVYPDNDPGDPLVNLLTLLSQGGPGSVGVRIATFSYGFYGEDAATLATLASACAAEGITLVKGSGDQGAWETAPSARFQGVDAMDSAPAVLSVGGLDIASSGNIAGNGNTTSVTGSAIVKAWGGDYLNALPVTDAQAYVAPNAASTGGYGSSPVPVWQAAFLPADAAGIGVPDLANLAGEPGLLGIQGGQTVSEGGTSLAAPVTAGLLADMEGTLGIGQKGLGAVGPLVFDAAKSDPQIFTQALWGGNGIYSVTSSAPGSWNPVTGLGLLHWDAMTAAYPALTAAATAVASLTLTAPVRSVIAGLPVTLTAVAKTAQGTPVLGIPLSFSTVGVAAIGAQSLVTNAQGVVEVSAYADQVGRTVIRVQAPSGASATLVLSYRPVVHVSAVTRGARAGENLRVEIRATDAGGHPLGGLPVRLDLPRGVVRIGGGLLHTGTNGSVFAILRRSTAGRAEIAANVAGTVGRVQLAWLATRPDSRAGRDRKKGTRA